MTQLVESQPKPKRSKTVAVIVMVTIAVAFFSFWLWRATPHVTISDIAMLQVTQPIMEPKGYGRQQFVAKVTNTGATPIFSPKYYLQIDTEPEIRTYYSDTIFLPAGGSYYFITSGLDYRLTSLKDSTEAKLVFRGNDWYIPKSYVEYQLKNIPLIELTLVSSTFHSTNQSCSIIVHFENHTKEVITLVKGTAVFLDSKDRILGGSGFVFEPTVTGNMNLWLSDVPGAAKSSRCVLQIHHFRDASHEVPPSIAPVPSVH